KIGGQPNVVEVQFRRFDESLRHLRMQWWQQERDVAGLQDADPLPGSRVQHAGIIAEALQIEKLSDPSRAKANKSLKRGEIPHAAEHPDITLDIRFEIIAEGLRGMKALVVDPRIETGEEQFIGTHTGMDRACLLDGKGDQVQDR